MQSKVQESELKLTKAEMTGSPDGTYCVQLQPAFIRGKGGKVSPGELSKCTKGADRAHISLCFSGFCNGKLRQVQLHLVNSTISTVNPLLLEN